MEEHSDMPPYAIPDVPPGSYLELGPEINQEASSVTVLEVAMEQRGYNSPVKRWSDYEEIKEKKLDILPPNSNSNYEDLPSGRF